MKYRYSLIDSDNELVIAYCNKIDGLDGKVVEIDEEQYHKIVFFDIDFCDEYKAYLQKNKMKFASIIEINIYDNNMKIIARFTFCNDIKIRHTEVDKLKSHTDFKLIGNLGGMASENELCLWEKWISSYPKEKNEWVTLDANGRSDWLRMLRIAYCCGYNKVEENTKKVFYLDGINITTYESFFIAFAEALNGPGTYFGSCLGGLDDCLCGGFGITTPFKVIWNNSSVAVKHLNENEWKRRKLYLIERYKRELDYVAVEDMEGNDSDFNVFYGIIDTLLTNGVEVVLIP
ncbi:MAG: barstar family protein [Vallitalea sp.]|jgi:hypothetical protein|nr:barstar family protein [Vallitalea sp.]